MKYNDTYFSHPTALVYGDVSIQENSSLWINSVIRAENHKVEIGKYTNIQDFVMIHVGMRTPVKIGDYCSITHRVVIHGATIGDNTLIGIGAIIMDGCQIGDNCIIGSGVCVKEKTKIPSNSIVEGAFGEIIRPRNNYIMNKFNAYMYYQNAIAYTKGNYRRWEEEELKQEGYAKLKEYKEEFDRLFSDNKNT